MFRQCVDGAIVHRIGYGWHRPNLCLFGEDIPDEEMYIGRISSCNNLKSNHN